MKSAGYDPAIKTMEIEFNGGVYQYYLVPKEVFDGLMASESKGRYFQMHVQGFFNYNRVG